MASSSSPTYAREEKLWNILGWTLCFLDTLGGALFLPVLPALVQELGSSSSPASTAAWVGVLASVYFASRSGSLGALRWFSSASSSTVAVPKPSPVRLGVLLVLSASLYLACGLTVKRDSEGGSLWWLAALRALAGVLAAAHRALGCGCLDQTGAASVTLIRKSPHESSAVSLLVSFTLASALFNPHRFRPTLELCLAAAVVHAPACVALVLLWQRSAGRGRTVADATGYSTVRGTPGGSDAELELMGRQPWGARDSGDGRRGSGVVAVAAAAAAAAGAGAAGAAAAVPAADAAVSDGGGGDVAPGKVEGEIIVPGRYLRGCKGDVVEAERRWRLTLDWRAKERVDEVLREPQPHFDVIKRHYPHFIHRHARNGCPVWIELPGRIDLPAIRSGGVSPEALQRHYVFVTEYLWGIVEPDFENGQAVTVLDVQGLGMRDLAGEALGFVKQATAIVQDHYVERSNRMFIINAPSYFSMIWRVIRPMLNERTQAKIGIINTDKKKIAEALLECIAPEDLPREYGGTCPLDLGESEEEVNLRAYVAGITPSLAPPPHHDDDDAQEDLEVEVDLHTAVTGPHADGGPGVAADREGNDVSSASPPHGDTPGGEEGRGPDEGNAPGAARRALGTVTGALSWAGGKFSWRRSPVAHLGDENGFEYDPDLQRWVLRDGKEKSATGGRRASGGGDRSRGAARASGGGEGRKERGGSRGHPSSSRRPVRSSSMGSSTSEEMTVLAIQAAHHSLAEAGTKLSPVPSEASAIPGVLEAGIGRLTGAYPTPDGSSRLKYSNAEEGGSREASGLGHPAPSGSNAMDTLEVHLPCATKTCGSRCCRLELASVLYVSGVAVREALPLWLLFGASAGGVGAASSQIGMFFAAGVILAEAAAAVASAGWCGALWVDGSSGVGGSGGGRRLLVAVRARFVVVVVLGLMYLLFRLLSAFPPAVLFAAVAALVASNHAAIELCTASIFQRSNSRSRGGLEVDVSDGEDGTRAASSDSSSRYRGYRGTARGGAPRGTMVISASALAGDVLGAAAGPFFIALVLCTGWPSPFDSSSWLVLGLCGDLWLSTGSREVEPQHAGLLFADDGRAAEEEHRAGRFAQFV